MKASLCLLLAILCHVGLAGTGDVLRCVADINAAVDRGATGLCYDVTVQLVAPLYPHRVSFYAADSTGTAMFGMDPSIWADCPKTAGDIVHIKGITIPTGEGKVGLHSRQIVFLSHTKPPEPQQITSRELYRDAKLKNRLVTLNGTVHDAFRDEIDYPWSYLILNSDGLMVYVAIFSEEAPPDELDRLVGAKITVEGIVIDHYYGSRVTLKRYLSVQHISGIMVQSAPRADPFNAPEIDKELFPAPIATQVTERRRTTGHVIAVWDGGSRLLLKSGTGDLIRIDLKSPKPPHSGAHIEAVGFPETDFYLNNLAGAIWRFAPGEPFQAEDAVFLPAARFFTVDKGRAIKKASLYGHAVRLRGTVRALPPGGTGEGRMYLESDTFMIPVDVSGCPEALDGITVGCTLDVAGTCVIETDNWRPTSVFPQIKEILVAVRTAADVQLVARPPWWTPGRLFALIGALLAVISGIFAWNMALRRRAEFRGKELAAEQLAHVSSELKVYERTRLAVELHDSLSQTLTGVSMGIDSALDIAGDANADLRRQLQLTSKTMEACRTELRNCLWDLRSQALEAEDMEQAIRLALGQILATTGLAIRFNVPRSRFSDKTTHAILHIIRELAANAVRHGHATSIKIAGSIEGGKLKFSVQDNGCGFDPESAPGIDKGHFGLQGIRERLELMDGEMMIDSRPGLGTKVTATLNIPSEKSLEDACNG